MNHEMNEYLYASGPTYGCLKNDLHPAGSSLLEAPVEWQSNGFLDYLELSKFCSIVMGDLHLLG